MLVIRSSYCVDQERNVIKANQIFVKAKIRLQIVYRICTNEI